MMPQEERVQAMVRAGSITAAEGERLLSALRTRRRDLPGPRVLISPMDYLPGGTMALLTIVGVVAGIVVGGFGIRFDGALDVHPTPTTPTLALALFDSVNVVLVPALFFWSASWLLGRQGRLVDFVLGIGVARLPLVTIGVLAAWALPPWEELSRQTLTSAPGGKVVMMSLLATPLYVWFITLLYQGFRTSSGLTGRRCALGFVAALIGAEVASKVLLAFGQVLAVVAIVPALHAQGVGAPPRRPQTPVGPFPYAQEEVVVRNAAAGVRLAGTLTLPKASGRLPAVVLLTGSGGQDRDETLFGHKPFLVLADHLTRLGVAVLRYDDRGVGGSDLGSLSATSADFADDARAAVSFLAGRADIDPKRIGLIGHSEGAQLAAMAAADGPGVAFVVMLAGAGLPGDEIIHAQARLLARAQKAPDELVVWEDELRRRVIDAVKRETDGQPNAPHRNQMIEDLAALPRPPGVPDGVAPKLVAQLLAAYSIPWFRYFLSFDPRSVLSKVRVPVLAIGGERDLQVPAAENLAAIEQSLRAGGNRDVTVVTVPGVNHLLQTSVTGLPAEYATLEETIAPAVLQLIGDWIRRRGA